jgi:hypothetical protein
MIRTAHRKRRRAKVSRYGLWLSSKDPSVFFHKKTTACSSSRPSYFPESIAEFVNYLLLCFFFGRFRQVMQSILAAMAIPFHALFISFNL